MKVKVTYGLNSATSKGRNLHGMKRKDVLVGSKEVPTWPESSKVKTPQSKPFFLYTSTRRGGEPPSAYDLIRTNGLGINHSVAFWHSHVATG